MSTRTTAWLAWSVCVVTLLILTLSLLLVLLGWSTPRGWTPWREQAVSLVGLIGAPIVGGLIASRRPHNPYGWVWLGFGLGLALQRLAESYAAYALAPLRTISHLLGLGGPLALTLAPFLLLLFPTGRLPSRRWRFLAWIAAMSGAVLLSLNLLFDRPDEAGGLITMTTFVVVIVIFATIVLSVLSLVVRYRRASGVERQQLKWFALTAVLSGAFVVGQMLSLGRLFGESLSQLFDTATVAALYVAVGVAILRYRLYDIDVLINRTLVYGSLTATLVALLSS